MDSLQLIFKLTGAMSLLLNKVGDSTINWTCRIDHHTTFFVG